jgi:signal transduction histidine kinase
MRFSDPQKFTIISAVIIFCVSIATGYTASVFYRQTMIERELKSVHDLVQLIAREEEAEKEFSAQDLKNYAERAANEHLSHTFGALTRLPGFFQVTVFNSNQIIAWSTTTEIIGTKQTQHIEAVARALSDGSLSAFNPGLAEANNDHLIEFYVPFGLGAEGSVMAGVVGLYRSSASIDAAIQQGVHLLWLVNGVGGIILYFALYRLFLTVHHDRDKISSRFEKLTTDHKRLIQIEKLSAMGQMVTEVAHQLNNSLVGVVNLAELAELEIGNPARVKDILHQVRTAGEHCREYMQNVLRLGQLTRSERQVTDVDRLARETAEFFQQSMGGHPRVAFEAPAEPITCEVDPVLIRNALFNIIHNAAQVDQNGPIVVSCSREQRDGKWGCNLTVSDRGPGIPPEAADKVFMPFFTTRSDGTGLGLPIAQHIAILHGGVITAENRPDGGSRFTIWIPEIETTREIENSAR